MVKSMVMHTLDYNWLAPCEEWYYRCHGPQLARRYGPWLTRFESFRPVPFPAGHRPEDYGYANWLCTVGYWREVPLEGLRGEQALTTPPVPAVNYSCMLPPQAEEDLKGGYTTPENTACLRWLLFLQYPEALSAEEGHRRFREVLAPRIIQEPHVYRAFTSAALTQEIHLPGVWTPEAEAQMHQLGSPANHRWDRMVELWFQTFADWEAFVSSPVWQGAEEAWSEHALFPFLRPYDHVVSTFLLERPAFDWLREQFVYR